MRIKLLHIPRYDANPFEKEKKTQEEEKLATVHFLPPLGIATLTAFLRKHNVSVDQDDLLIKVFYHNLRVSDPEKQINVRMFEDGNRIENFIKTGYDPELEGEGEKILKLTKCNGFDTFGFSLYEIKNPSPAGVALVLGKLLKEKYGATIIIGGHVHIEVLKKLLSTKFIDFGIYGKMEEVKLLNFCQLLEKKTPIKNIPGISFVNQQGNFVQTPFPEEHKKIPIKPDFNGLPMNLYKPKILCKVDGEEYKYSILMLPYFFVLGCPNRCAFCPDALGGWSAKSPEEVAREVMELSKKYRTKHFFFINTNINPTHEYANRVADALANHGIDILWSDCATLSNMDKSLLKKLRGVGATRLVWGMESGSLRVLRYICKPVPSISYGEKILKMAYKLGIWNELDLICGFPYETQQDVDSTIKFIMKNQKYIQVYHLSKFRADGDMRMHPEKYGIRLLKMKPALSRPGHAFPFDEIKGLRWKEKMKQIDYYYQRIIRAIRSIKPQFEINKIPNMSEEELFHIHFINWWKERKKTVIGKKTFISNTSIIGKY